MAMVSRKKRERRRNRWIAAGEVVHVPENAFHDRLTSIPDQHNVNRRTEYLCRKLYKRSQHARPGLAHGRLSIAGVPTAFSRFPHWS